MTGRTGRVAPGSDSGSDSGGDSGSDPGAGPGVVLGVVLDLPEPHSTVIDRWRLRSGDEQAGRIAPHVTLLPPTTVACEQVDEVLEHLGKVAADASTFTLDLAGTDSFRPVSQVVFVTVAGGADRCAALESALRSGLLDGPREYPFHPHVTVAHDVADHALDDAAAGLADFVARFRVDGFSLYRFLDGPEPHWSFERHFAFATPT